MHTNIVHALGKHNRWVQCASGQAGARDTSDVQDTAGYIVLEAGLLQCPVYGATLEGDLELV